MAEWHARGQKPHDMAFMCLYEEPSVIHSIGIPNHFTACVTKSLYKATHITDRALTFVHEVVQPYGDCRLLVQVLKRALFNHGQEAVRRTGGPQCNKVTLIERYVFPAVPK